MKHATNLLRPPLLALRIWAVAVLVGLPFYTAYVADQSAPTDVPVIDSTFRHMAAEDGDDTGADPSLRLAPENTVTEASAGNATLFHYSPDDGYDPAIRVACDDGYRIGIPEGVGSGNAAVCGTTLTTNHGGHIRSIYIRAGEEMWCRYTVWTDGVATGSVWRKRLDITGWHPKDQSFNDGHGCTLRED